MEKEKLLRKIKIDRLNFFENLFSARWFNELVEQKKIQKIFISKKAKRLRKKIVRTWLRTYRKSFVCDTIKA